IRAAWPRPAASRTLARSSARDRQQGGGANRDDGSARAAGARSHRGGWRWCMSPAATRLGQPHVDIAEVKLAYPLLDGEVNRRVHVYRDGQSIAGPSIDGLFAVCADHDDLGVIGLLE